MITNCVRCGKNPIFIKKTMLCSLCYGKDRRDNTKHRRENNNREFDFIKNFFTHNQWIHYPCTFSLGEIGDYSPDFYDQSRNVFIEVVGSRQAFHQNKDKYEAFYKIFSKIQLEVRHIDGTELKQDENKKYVWQEKQ